MKSSKRDRERDVQRKSSNKKSGAKTASSVKLDRKSSRGMIYENEELRLRTININAEVERGQSDIRKLRRENEQLRREIWSLRDEYDRLNKRFKANKYLPDSISEHGQSESNSEDSDSCDTCRGEAEINEDCLVEQHDRQGRHREHLQSSPARQQYDRYPQDGSIPKNESSSIQNSSTSATESYESSSGAAVAKSRDHLHVNFDHLSIVSEENLSNSDGNLTQPSEVNHQPQQHQPQSQYNYHYDENFIEIDGSRLSPSECMGAMSLPSLVGPLTPMTPIELVANELNDLQSMVPPLSYFENVVQQQHMGSTIASMADSNTSTNTGETVIQTNGWDYNIQSPFIQRKFQSSENSSSNSTSTTMSPSHLNNPGAIVREDTPQLDVSTNGSHDASCKNPKHFFSPIKPRLKLDTALAAKAASMNIPPAVQYLEHLHHNCDPPDVYITNALASPYYPQPIGGLSLPSVLVPPVHKPYIEPIYAIAQKKNYNSEQRSWPATGSSKDSVNLEQILNEIGTISEDILQLQLEKNRSQEKLISEGSNYFTTPPTTASASATNTPLHTATTHTETQSSTSSPTHIQKDQHQPGMSCDKNHKPYRSEMNLLLSYNGANPVIIPLNKNPATGGSGDISTSEAAQVSVVEGSGGGTIDRDGSSPSPPQLPIPMVPFPPNLVYLGFDRLAQQPPLSDSNIGEPLYSSVKVDLPCNPSSSHQHLTAITTTTPASPHPKQPPSSFPDTDQTGLLIRDQDYTHPTLAISSPDLSTSPLSGVNLANAPLKRRIFSRNHDDGSSSQITRSFDGSDVRHDTKQQVILPEVVKNKLLLEGSVNEISSFESSSGSEASKRKNSRRVSIVCRDDKNPDSNDGVPFDRHQSSASVDKLDDMMPSLIANLKHAHSTPNSPHSNRRRCGNNNSSISVNSGSSTLHHHGHHHHHHHHHHHNRKLSQESIAEGRGASVSNSIVNSSQDNVLGAATTSSHQNATRYKCSRRHSEGTVSSIAGGDRSGAGGSVAPAAGNTGIRLSTTGNHHHHHHNQDSNQETGTSISERNSGSLGSSRESSTSLSMRSQRRKISISSHTGGKIPWCGCWGNGCL